MDQRRQRESVLRLMRLLISIDERCNSDCLMVSARTSTLEEFPHGFTVNVLDVLLGVMEELYRRLDSSSWGLKFLCQIVDHLGQPLWRNSEHSVEDQDLYLQETYNMVALLLKQCPLVEVQMCASRTLKTIIGRDPGNLWAEDYRLKALRSDAYQHCLEEGQVFEVLTGAMRSTSDTSSYMIIMSLASKFCQRAAVYGRKFIAAGLPRVLIRRMLWSDEVLRFSVKVLLQMLDLQPWDAIVEHMTDREAVESIHSALKRTLVAVRSQQWRNLRNDITSLAMYSIEMSQPESPVITDLARDLLRLCVLTELGSKVEPFSSLKLTSFADDYEFKKQLLMLPRILLANRVTRQLMQEQSVLLALSMIISRDLGPGFGYSSSVAWSKSQFTELQLVALSTLASVAAHQPEEALKFCMGTRLLLYTTRALQEAAQVGPDHLLAGLQVLANMAIEGNSALVDDLADQNAIRMFLDCLRSEHIRHHVAEHHWPAYVAIVTQCLGAITSICEEGSHRNGMLGKDGVRVLICLLRKWQRRGGGATGPRVELILLRTVECVRACTTHCPINENEFIQQDGVAILVDLIHESSQSPLLCLQILGCLLHLCDQCPATAHFLLKWRAPGDILTSVELLLHLWQQENDVVNDFIRDKDGLIIATEGATHVGTKNDRDLSTNAIASMESQMRLKIFALIEHLKKIRSDCGGFAAEFVRLGLHDRVCMVEVEYYLDLQQSAVLAEVQAELAAEGIRPIAVDRQMLEQTHSTQQRKIARVQALQQTIRAGVAQLQDQTTEWQQRQRAQHQQFTRHSFNVTDHPLKTSDHSVPAESPQQEVEEASTTPCSYEISQASLTSESQ